MYNPLCLILSIRGELLLTQSMDGREETVFTGHSDFSHLFNPPFFTRICNIFGDSTANVSRQSRKRRWIRLSVGTISNLREVEPFDTLHARQASLADPLIARDVVCNSMV